MFTHDLPPLYLDVSKIYLVYSAVKDLAGASATAVTPDVVRGPPSLLPEQKKVDAGSSPA